MQQTRIQLGWSVFMAQYPHEACSEALDRSFVFLHIPSAEEARILKAIASHETGSLMNVTSAIV